MRRPVARWQAEKARTGRALRELPRCEYTEGCTGKGMGILAKLDPFRLVLACPACALRAKNAPRSGT